MSDNNISKNNQPVINEQDKPEEKPKNKLEEKSIEKPEEKKEEKPVEKTEEKIEEQKIEEKKEEQKIEEKPKENPKIKTEDMFKQKEIDPKSFCCVPTLIKTNTFNAPFPIRLTLDQLTYRLFKRLFNKRLPRSLLSKSRSNRQTKWHNKRSHYTINKMFMVRNSHESFFTYKNFRTSKYVRKIYRLVRFCPRFINKSWFMY